MPVTTWGDLNCITPTTRHGATPPWKIAAAASAATWWTSCELGKRAGYSSAARWHCEHHHEIQCNSVHSVARKYVVRNVRCCVWPSLSDPVISRTDDSHDYYGEKTKSFVPSRQGNWCSHQWMQEKGCNCKFNVRRELFHFFFFVIVLVAHKILCSHYHFRTFMCFQALPRCKESAVLSDIQENAALYEIPIAKTFI